MTKRFIVIRVSTQFVRVHAENEDAACDKAELLPSDAWGNDDEQTDAIELDAKDNLTRAPELWS